MLIPVRRISLTLLIFVVRKLFVRICNSYPFRMPRPSGHLHPQVRLCLFDRYLKHLRLRIYFIALIFWTSPTSQASDSLPFVCLGANHWSRNYPEHLSPRLTRFFQDTIALYEAVQSQDGAGDTLVELVDKSLRAPCLECGSI